MRTLLARRLPDVAGPALLVLLALVPLLPVFGSARLVAAAVGGVLAGTALAVVGAARRWGALTLLAATAVALVLLSPLAAPTTALGGLVPTPETIGSVGRGVVTSWKEVVTVAPPLGDGGARLTAPYLLGLVAALVAVSVALRTRRPALALVAPVLVLALAVLLGTADVTTAVPLGLALALGSLLWGTWRTGRAHAGRLPGVAALAALGLVAGAGVALLAPPEAPRLILRERVEPPPDIRDYASPLAGFRSHVKDHRDTALLTVSGLPAGTALRLAVLDAYDGTAWTVSGAAASGSGEFTRIGERIEPDVPAGLARVRVTVGEYAGVWVPVAGRAYDVDFTGARAETLERSFYFSRAGGTGLTTAGLRAGDTYEVLAAPVTAPRATELEGAPVADVELPPALFPESATTVAASMTAEATTPLAQIQAVEAGLQQGYFSHGLEGEAPSLPGHGAARVDELLAGEAMVGDEEQYAAAMGLMLRALGIPSRVVMGLEAAGDGDLTGEDVTAWVEVPFEGHGWVPFHPTPDEDRIWQDEAPQPQNRPQPQVLQPPPPAQEPPEAPPADRRDVEVEDEDEEEEQAFPLALLVAAVAGGLLLVLLLPLLVVVAVKALRARRRRLRGTPTQRVAGAWSEVIDAATDLGVDLPRTATRRQGARVVTAAVSGAGGALHQLAARADEATFGPVPPAEGDVEGHWGDVRATLTRLRAAVGRRRWWRSRVSTRSLRRPATRPAGRPRVRTTPDRAPAHPEETR
ncbi:transglutaminase-like domain-containing protein [Georgenia sp. M64]|uniref:transglutaminase-like domain-containing protein n=1 Tax=Georgenia sp. M64 TaxID=3120520 RepID=UPI0030E3DEC3